MRPAAVQMHQLILALTLKPNGAAVFTARRKANFASAVYATANTFVRPSVCLSVRHTTVLCQKEET